MFAVLNESISSKISNIVPPLTTLACRGVYPPSNIGTIQPEEVLSEGQGGRPPVCLHTIPKQNFCGV